MKELIEERFEAEVKAQVEAQSDTSDPLAIVSLQLPPAPLLEVAAAEEGEDEDEGALSNNNDALKSYVEEAEEGEDEDEGALSNNNDAPKSYVEELVASKTALYEADGNGKYDYARIRAGARVVHEHTAKPALKELGVVRKLLAKLKVAFYGFPPEVALSTAKLVPGNAMGEGQCFMFAENRGNFTLEFDRPVFANAVGVEHAVSMIRSAPENFTVWGYSGKKIGGGKKKKNHKKADQKGKNDDDWVNLGSFLFEGGVGGDNREGEEGGERVEDGRENGTNGKGKGDSNREELQEFKVKQHKQPAFQFMRFEFHNSQSGDRICLHRVKVFGKQ